MVNYNAWKISDLKILIVRIKKQKKNWHKEFCNKVKEDNENQCTVHTSTHRKHLAWEDNKKI